MASKVGYTQDMPPPGGYKAVETAQKLPKKGNVWLKLGILAGITGYGLVTYLISKKRWRLRRIEMNDARYAVYPLILAESQRCELMYWRKNRDEENELMKDVDGWTTGTIFGEPLYYNPRGRHVQKSGSLEYVMHTSFQDAWKMATYYRPRFGEQIDENRKLY